ncbi:hypothetical protein E2N91_26355 [Pseudomonas syringae pv. tomato]|nr:hypothetical protein E2N91_26355 [Pseudomonas syringae pv. tomato]TES76582.1 hypothetical protein E2N89_17470 [Pseudomonas syringae pv. tomato]
MRTCDAAASASGVCLSSARACGAAASADSCGLMGTPASAVGGIPCATHSLVWRDSGLARKSISRRSRACDAGASGGAGKRGLFEELAPLLDPCAPPDAGSGSVWPTK